MSTAKTSRPFKLFLKAGVPEIIQQRSEFWFVDQGRDLVIRADSSIHDGVKAGDSSRPTEPFDELTITSPYDQVVVLRVGWGEWNRLIVSGEMNVTAYVETRTNGVAKSLPFELTKTVGLLNTTEASYIIDDVALTSGTTVDEHVPVYWDGELIYVGKHVLYYMREDTADGTWDRSVSLDTSLVTPYRSNNDVQAAAVDEFGMIYFFGVRDMFRVSVSGGAVHLVTDALAADADSPTGYSANGVVYRDGYFYTYDNGYIIKFDRSGNFIEKTHRDALGWPGSKTRIGLLRGSPVAYSTSSSTSHYRLDDNFNYVETVTGDVYLAQGWQELPDGRRVAVASLTYMTLRELETRTEYGVVYVQDGADTATRRYVYLDQPPRVFGRANGSLGLWDGNVKRILQVAADKVDENYLDYVTAIEFNDGNITRKVGSGTRSFALRGIDDVFPVKHESEVTITVLPEFFD